VWSGSHGRGADAGQYAGAVRIGLDASVLKGSRDHAAPPRDLGTIRHPVTMLKLMTREEAIAEAKRRQAFDPDASLKVSRLPGRVLSVIRGMRAVSPRRASFSTR